MNHTDVIQLCREVLRLVDRPSAGTAVWNADAQWAAEQLRKALDEPDPACGALLMKAPDDGHKYGPLKCQRPAEHKDDHGVRVFGGWHSWPRRNAKPAEPPLIQVKSE